MATEVKIPIPDQTTEEVRIVKWQKAIGDAVTKGDIVLEVETDKSVIEVEAAGDGVLLKQLAIEDDMIPVGQVVGFIGQAGEDVGEVSAAPPQEKPAAATSAPAATQASSSPSNPDITEVKIPIPDQTTEEVRIVKWQKAIGDAIAKGDIVLEVETDKSVMEVEATGDGVLLSQMFAVDDMVPVGAVVGQIGTAGTKVASPAATAATPPPAAVAEPTSNERVKASPVAKKLATKLGIDLNSVKGTGPGGRIVRNDVENATSATPAARPGGRIFASPNAKRLARELSIDIAQVAGTGPNGRIIGVNVTEYAASAPAPTSAAPAQGQPQPGTSVKVSRMRRAIGINLQKSARDTPHFNVTMSIDMTWAMKTRVTLNKSRPKEKRVSVNDLVIKACAVALEQFPAVNSRLDGDQIHYLPQINIGVATAVEAGLVVPVLTDANKRDWYNLSEEAKRLAQEARNGKIIGAGKGTFTVSNLGMFGVDNFTAIINPPESAILAVGAGKNEVVDIGGGIGIRPIMKVTLCSDHRVIDGALAAQFLQAIKLYLEKDIAW